MFAANGKRKHQTSVVCCEPKRKTEVCFPWSANHKRFSSVAVSANLSIYVTNLGCPTACGKADWGEPEALCDAGLQVLHLPQAGLCKAAIPSSHHRLDLLRQQLHLKDFFCCCAFQPRKSYKIFKLFTELTFWKHCDAAAYLLFLKICIPSFYKRKIARTAIKKVLQVERFLY